MAKFKYRMQNILDIKNKLEEQAKNEYAIARARLSEEEEKLIGLQKRKNGYEDKKRELQESNLNIQDIIENIQAIDTMKELISIQRTEVQKAEKALELQRIKLQEIMQERKTHDKLKERAFAEFMQELNAQESKEIDELTSYTYGKKGADRRQ